MEFNSQELRRRKALRQIQKQDEAKKHKGRRIALLCILCVVLLGALGVTGYYIVKKINTPKPTPVTTAPVNTTVIHLAAAGDLNVTKKVVGTATDYTNTFLDVAPELSNAHLTALNFEGGLYGAPYGEDASAPPALPQALKNAGVDLVQLANSFSIYRGTSGLAATISGMQQEGLTALGAWSTPAEAQASGGYTICEVEGVKIAFVAFTKGMDGMALPASSYGCVNLLYKDYASSYQEVDEEGISKVLGAVEQEKPDLTVAMLHWGSTFNDTVSTSQEKIVTLMQENGVDAIIGTHSHYVQKMSFDPATGAFVAYSLGDFIGDADRPGSEYSVILDLEITKNNDTGETKITGFSYTPIFTVTEGETLRVLKIDDAIAAYENGYIDRVSQATYEAMVYAKGRIDARIKAE